jgi:hypothetical protein
MANTNTDTDTGTNHNPIAIRIREACTRKHKQDGSVFAPQICIWCMGCPIGTIVACLSGLEVPADGPGPIPEEHVAAVTDWLDSLA